MTLTIRFEKVELISLPLQSIAPTMASLGTSCSGTIITRDIYAVSDTLDNQDSAYVYDSLLEETTEISRDTATLESSGSSSTLKLSGLHSDISGTKTIQDIITMTPYAAVLNSIEENEVASVTIDGSMSWNKDECALYLSSDKIFRFKYNSSNGTDPSRLSLESLNQEGTIYIPKFEITRGL
jgi:hypothetical protein